MATAMKNGSCVFTCLDEQAIKDAKWELKFFKDRKGINDEKKYPWEPLPPQMPRSRYPNPPPTGATCRLSTSKSLSRLETGKSRPRSTMTGTTRGSRRSVISLSNASTSVMCKLCEGHCENVGEHFPNLSDGRPITGGLKKAPSTPALPDVSLLTRRMQCRRNDNGNFYSDAPSWKQGV
mmetsp:Transcript_128758/g.223301  ORF Transcript_128758/g.223301 Transcript_128758/m.223301 type:complete len:179 (-) Transcript_128758:70-606(-)